MIKRSVAYALDDKLTCLGRIRILSMASIEGEAAVLACLTTSEISLHTRPTSITVPATPAYTDKRPDLQTLSVSCRAGRDHPAYHFMTCDARIVDARPCTVLYKVIRAAYSGRVHFDEDFVLFQFPSLNIDDLPALVRTRADY